MELYIYLMPFALILGIFTSYTDMKLSKIRNNILLYSLISMIFINIVFALLIKDVLFLYERYYFQYVLSVIFILVLSVILWLMGFWNAADSKLITVFSIAITPGMVNYNFSNLYIANFFYNIIMINLFFLIFRSFRDGFSNSFKNIRQNIHFLRKISWSEQILLFITMYSFGIISRIFFFIPDQIDRFYVVIISMMILMKFLRKLKSWYVILFSFFIFNTIYNFDNLLNISYWYDIISFYLIINILRFAFEFLGLINVISVSFKDLKEGMHLAQDLKVDTTEGENSKNLAILIEYDQSMGLTKKNIIDMQKISKTLKKKEILISQKDIFAPYVFAGYILTLLLHTNIITYLRLLFFA